MLVFSIITGISASAAICGVVYCCFCLLNAWLYRHRNSKSNCEGRSPFTPGVSILKPVCGVDPHAYESIRSHCLLDYPDFEIIFAVRESDDPVVPIIHRVMHDFPECRIRLVACPLVSGMNLKISNLVQVLPLASKEYILINDSDIAVPPDYLRKVVAPLEDSSIGMVTCLYKAIPAPTLGSRLESLGVTADFIPGVLSAATIGRGLSFGLGSTLCLHRRTLERIGGLESIADYLADDYEMGYRCFQQGLRIALADCVVEHFLPGYSIREMMQHQLRWARTIRCSRPGGYAGLVLTFALPWSVLAVVFSGVSVWASMLLLAAVGSRLTVAVTFGVFVLRDRRIWRDAWLIPIKDITAALLWVASYMGKSIVWRGRRFELEHGKLRPA